MEDIQEGLKTEGNNPEAWALLGTFAFFPHSFRRHRLPQTKLQGIYRWIRTRQGSLRRTADREALHHASTR